MRYRPFNRSGLSTSAITLALPAGALGQADAFRLICAALEQGINSFAIPEGDAAVDAALGQAAASVGRAVLVLMLRLGPERGGEELAPRVGEAARACGAGFFDVLAFDGSHVLSPGLLAQIEALKAARQVRMAAMAADDASAELALGAAEFDVLGLTYNLRSGWAERNRMKSAAARGMTLIGRNFGIDPARPAAGSDAPKGLARLFRKPAPTPAQVREAYQFMSQTRDWTPHQICLAYALTEPALATVEVEAASPARVEELAAAVERELPAGVAAQIEMARFAESAAA